MAPPRNGVANASKVPMPGLAYLGFVQVPWSGHPPPAASRCAKMVLSAKVGHLRGQGILHGSGYHHRDQSANPQPSGARSQGALFRGIPQEGAEFPRFTNELLASNPKRRTTRDPPMRLLICSFGSPGYLYPLLGIAHRLAHLDHDVRFTAPMASETLIESQGFERIPRPSKDGNSFIVSAWASPEATAIDVVHTAHAIKTFAPDAIVTHALCQAPLVVRAMFRIPVAVLGFFSYLWPSNAATGHTKLDRLKSWRLEGSINHLNNARSVFRLPCLDESTHHLNADLFLLRTVPDLDPGVDALPDEVMPVGACLWEPDRDNRVSWNELRKMMTYPKAPVVYAHQGRLFGHRGFWSDMVEGLRGRRYQVFASGSRMDIDLSSLPSTFVVLPHIPFSSVLPQAQATIAAGHTSIVLTSLWYGLPSLLIPDGGETPDNAFVLQNAGCALTLSNGTVTPRRLRKDLERVISDDSMAQRARTLQRTLRSLDSFELAAKLITTRLA